MTKFSNNFEMAKSLEFKIFRKYFKTNISYGPSEKFQEYFRRNLKLGIVVISGIFINIFSTYHQRLWWVREQKSHRRRLPNQQTCRLLPGCGQSPKIDDRLKKKLKSHGRRLLNQRTCRSLPKCGQSPKMDDINKN